jgi:hypothetical protein
MSKRYVIQVWTNDTNELKDAWVTVQHPAGGDWKSRSRTKLIGEAAQMILKGELRELRIAESVPVYELVEVVNPDEVSNAAGELAKITADTAAEVAKYGQFELVDDDADLTEKLEAQVGEVPASDDDTAAEVAYFLK